jgi:3',5'-cyclic-AMP phosphodiesterase
MSKYIEHNPDNDGIDRRGFLKCMAWAGTGLVWTLRGGLLTSRALGAEPDPPTAGDFTFVQISDSHIGFAKEPNKDVVGTLQAAISRINRLPQAPELLIHTGDLTHLAKPDEFDTLAEVLKSAKVGQAFYVPGEHDVFTDEGKLYLERYGKGTRGSGWQSFDYKGVHFIGLVNVANLKPGGLGLLGPDQVEWLKRDVADLGNSTPIVVFAHVPLWTVYPQWGWGTEDSAQALSHLKRFGAVTVLNGHIHQILQKVEGNVTFHTACSTAFPQPEPGKAESPGPLKNVPAEKLRSLLGLTSVNYVQRSSALAIVDSALG